MKRFILLRHKDTSGISGTGVVAEGVQFTDLTVAMRWRSGDPSTVIYDNIGQVERNHGHNGNTEVVFLDV